MSVYIFDEFLTEAECDQLISYLDTMAAPSPREGILVGMGYPTSTIASKAGYGEPPIFGLPPGETNENLDLVGDVLRRTRSKFEEVFGEEAWLTQCNYQVMTKGGFNPLHSDTTDLDGNPLQSDGTPEEMEWSGLIYLNNHGEEYEGGTIKFPKQDLEVFPRKGQLVMFKGDYEHVHEVPAVVWGDRKNLVFFYGPPERIGKDDPDRNFYQFGDGVA